MNRTNLKNVFLSFAVVLLSSQSFGWGTKGHETIEEVAIRLMPNNDMTQLFKRNIRGMKYLSMVPDMAWKHGTEPHPLEAQSHFFQIDFYAPRGGALKPDIEVYLERAGTPNILLREGTAPWRVQQMTWVLVSALKQKKPDPELIIQMAATLGHYVGDIGNPLHVATDYDGVQIGEKGLHSFFETATVNEMPDDELTGDVLKAAQEILATLPERIAPIAGAFALAKTADFHSDSVLAAAKKLGQTQAFKNKMHPIIIQTLAMSAAMLAKIWTQAYVLQAGSPEFSTENLGKVPVPDWVPITYIPGVKSK